MADLRAIAENLIKGQAPKVEELVNQALEEGVSARDILHNGLIEGMNVVGTKFKGNQFHIPEVLIAARAMKAGMALIRQPKEPEWVPSMLHFTIGFRNAPESWRDFLYWNIELESG